MNKLLIILGVVLVLAYMSFFKVNEREKAILLQFGEIKKHDYTPGMYFKIPLFQNVKKFDARLLTKLSNAEQFLTSEKKNVLVDSFVKWRIGNPKQFYTAMGGDERNASTKIEQIINRGLRDEFGTRTIQEAISGERTQIMSVISAMANKELGRFGIDIRDVRIKRIDLPDDVSESVFKRMNSERERVAKQFRSEGEEKSQRTRAEADKKYKIILAEAERDAAINRGEGEAKAALTYGIAFKRNPEFYSFWRSTQAYRDTFRKANGDVLVLEPKSEFFDYFHKSRKSSK